MKSNTPYFRHSFSCGLIALTGLCLVGCRTPHKTTHLSNGYEEVSTHARTFLAMDDPAPERIGFQYMSPDGKLTRIWPSLYGMKEVIHGGLAVFVGDQVSVEDGAVNNHPSLFAVTAPALPVDITGEVLSLWAKSSGKDFSTAKQRFTVATPEEASDGLLLHLEFASSDYLVVDKNWPDKADLKIAWDQVTNIMETVKSKGGVKRDNGWHTPFIGAQY